MFGKRQRGLRQPWGVHKRRIAEREESTPEDVELRAFFADALTLVPAPCTFDMDSEKLQLAAEVWASKPLLGANSLTDANGALAAVLEVITRNGYHPKPGETREASEHRREFRVEGLLTNLARIQSQKQVTVMTARISVAAYRAQLPRMVWKIISLLAPGLLCSYTWTHAFVVIARPLRPACPYPLLLLVGGVMFDNYTRRVLYSSAVTVEKHGYLLNMTNWASMSIPRILAPANFNAAELCEPSTTEPSALHTLACLVPLRSADKLLFACAHRGKPVRNNLNGCLYFKVYALEFRNSGE